MALNRAETLGASKELLAVRLLPLWAEVASSLFGDENGNP